MKILSGNFKAKVERENTFQPDNWEWQPTTG